MKKLRPLTTPTGWLILPVHYSADPAKATPEWYAAARESYPDEGVWEREFEISFRSQHGHVCCPRFGPQHQVRGLRIDPRLPIRLCMDFNFSPMNWVLAQIQNGWIRAVEEIVQRGASVESMVTEFRNRYADHKAGIFVYGDATGGNMDAHSGRSYYQLFQLAMRGYPSRIEYRVPTRNPAQVARVNAINRRLEAADGMPGVEIDAENCPELVLDFQEVVWKQKVKPARGSSADVEILKVSDPADPYYFRTHGFDSFTYFVAREYPVGKELALLPAPVVAARAARKPKFVYGARI